MTGSVAYSAKHLFDGEHFHDDVALLVRNGSVAGLASLSDVPDGYALHDHVSDLLVPGFVDLQVNGGGGALLNDTPTKDAIETICSANARFGTTSVLPTLITDAPEVRDAVLAAGAEAKRAKVPGFLGLHLEGPHLSRSRKGAHVEDFIRPMDDADLAALTKAVGTFGQAMTTVAPENVTLDQVKALVAAGWKVSVGHTDCKAADAKAYFEAGASMVTHLFNAMSQMGNREPGVVGAALTSDTVWCGLIADCVHVDPLSMAIALRAKQGAGRIFFVTDAMSPTGTDATEFILGGRTIYRRDGRLTLADGTLAGADIDMLSMIKLAHERLSLSLADVLKMASLYPSQAIGAANKGHLRTGADADFVLMGADLSLHSTWIGGQCCFSRT
ncbi:N-acetylglucosamine-6-phosphate deacetylase [Cohaesibacter intestini]|uniref:N-acetylglucosamine-6-phosphate deacetylase n=1 Tax=Cohaesibacter intestini TaxID=2211145 RepID=UPI000DEA10BB|nr:N-acetylglucosamine-6-phosphate deacetylase [Cohaesibacter intestini]